MPEQVKTRDGIEFTASWTCPECGHHQIDTIHPVLGPWISVICGKCESGFHDHQLPQKDRASLDAARDAAEAYGIEHGIEIA